MQRIIGDKTAPYQAPQRVNRLAGITAANRLMQRIEEAGACRFKNCENLLLTLGERLDDWALLRQQRQLVGEKECDTSVAFTERLHACPCDFACSNQRIEPGGVVARDA